MLQQTRVETVIPYFQRFLARFPDLPRLARADLQEVLKLWEGLGYYARARNLHRAVGIVMAEHGGRVPSQAEDFRKLPGVGDYICAAVLSIAFGIPLPVVDGNVKRVLARLLLIAVPVNRPASHTEFRAAAQTLLDGNRPGTFNQALMELGATVCRPRRPLCPKCPVAERCRALQRDVVSRYPFRVQKAPAPLRHLAAAVVSRKGRFLIVQRKTDGLLGGLWEFPGGELLESEDPHQACLRTILSTVGLTIRVEKYLTRVRHAYTHFRVLLDVYCCTWVSGRVRLKGPVDHRWVSPAEFDRFPFPKANHKFIGLLKTFGCEVKASSET
jgi:A/G-specific adenine glycosylase